MRNVFWCGIMTLRISRKFVRRVFLTGGGRRCKSLRTAQLGHVTALTALFSLTLGVAYGGAPKRERMILSEGMQRQPAAPGEGAYIFRLDIDP